MQTDSEAYARKVERSNLLKASQTICYLQEHGIGSREELRQEKGRAVEKASSAETALRKTDEQIKAINERIHYAGQYYSTKEVHNEYKSALVKTWFRRQHAKELDRYDQAVSYFRNNIGELIPPMKYLKTKKADLLTQKAMQEETLRAAVQRREELKTASYNVRWILSTDESRKQYRERGSVERNKKRRSVLTL